MAALSNCIAHSFKTNRTSFVAAPRKCLSLLLLPNLNFLSIDNTSAVATNGRSIFIFSLLLIAQPHKQLLTNFGVARYQATKRDEDDSEYRNDDDGSSGLIVRWNWTHCDVWILKYFESIIAAVLPTLNDVVIESAWDLSRFSEVSILIGHIFCAWGEGICDGIVLAACLEAYLASIFTLNASELTLWAIRLAQVHKDDEPCHKETVIAAFYNTFPHNNIINRLNLLPIFSHSHVILLIWYWCSNWPD
jgi:hypothetical protein